MWLGFPTIEERAIDHDLPELKFKQHTVNSTENLHRQSSRSLEHSPHFTKGFYPMERPDGEQGHYLHFTQLSKHTVLDEFGFEPNGF